MIQIIIERANNDVLELEEAVNKRLKALGKGWRVSSAITTAETASVWKENNDFGPEKKALAPAGSPKHVVYVTTVVMEKAG